MLIGTITGEYTTQEAIGGSDIVLTIDANLQRVTEEALANCIAGIRAGAYSQVYEAKRRRLCSNGCQYRRNPSNGKQS